MPKTQLAVDMPENNSRKRLLQRYIPYGIFEMQKRQNCNIRQILLRLWKGGIRMLEKEKIGKRIAFVWLKDALADVPESTAGLFCALLVKLSEIPLYILDN